MEKTFSAGARSRTHPLGSITRDQLAVNKSGGEAASLSVGPSVRLSVTNALLSRTNEPGSLSLTAASLSLSLPLSLICPSFQDPSISLSLSFSFPLSFYHFVSTSLTVPLSPSLFPPLSVAPGLLSIFRSLYTHTLRIPALSLSFYLSTASSLS